MLKQTEHKHKLYSFSTDECFLSCLLFSKDFSIKAFASYAQVFPDVKH